MTEVISVGHIMMSLPLFSLPYLEEKIEKKSINNALLDNPCTVRVSEKSFGK